VRDAREELQEEARTTSRFHHRNICRCLGSGEVDGIVFMTLELLEGEDLGTHLDRVGSLEVDAALTVGADVARGLAALHRRGVIHRDLKPANIQVTPDGRAKILDLGTPAARRRRLRSGGFEYFGTPEYSAPEQCRCQEALVGPQTDLYALGILLYEMLSGRPPFSFPSTTRTLREQVRGRPVDLERLRDGLPYPLLRLIRRLLVKEIESRPRSARHVATQLERVRQDTPAGRGAELTIGS
jgi:serine/threonine-protein kinase